MTIHTPDLTNRNHGILKAASAGAAVIILLALWNTPPVGVHLTGLAEKLGMGAGLLKYIFWFILLLIVNETVLRSARTLWLKLRKKPELTAVVGSGDLQVIPRDISAVPGFRRAFSVQTDLGEKNTISLVNTLLSMGFSLGASDIHISPGPDHAEVNLRIHGNLYPLGRIPGKLYPHFTRRVKILSGLSIFRQSIPQDGQVNFQDSGYTARVSVFPTISGERIALRLSMGAGGIIELDELGMPYTILPDYKALLDRSQGMIIINGPTGSGKTTTLFSSLARIQQKHSDRANIITLEDPIELHLQGVQQTRVEQDTGLSFSEGLRSVLRQDPDVIMLGEIRDEETAKIAVRAAMTGHLILTTVHSASAAGVFERLSQMGVDQVQLAATVRAVLSQRLCRKLCPSCRRKAALTDEHRRQLKLLGLQTDPEGPFYESPGCDKCLGKGFNGRVAIFEMILVTDAMKDLISQGTPAHVLAQHTSEAGMPALIDHGLSLARNGDISLLELMRVVSD